MLSSLAASVALAVALAGAPQAPVPRYPVSDPALPRVGAVTWIVYDETADVVLATWNANDRRPMASVTKVLTAIVVLDHSDLDDIVTVPGFATRARGSTAGLVAGEEWSVNDLLVAMLVRSGNDAALTLAWHVGNGSTEAFVDMMNVRAGQLGMRGSHFANPNGLDHAEHYSTAADLLTLTLASLEYGEIERIARIRLVKMPADPTGRSRNLTNTNQLLGTYPGVVGLKTGDTPFADKVLLGVAERGSRRIVTVVMGSQDHFTDTRELMDWAFRTYGIRDRLLRPIYADQGGGATTVADVDLAAGHERRLSGMPALDAGRWEMSAIEDLPAGKALGDWLREALPESIGGNE